ncbi:CBO0543 family protein [Bacillus sp. 2205SS5-2]|uniref:CBO0543 family protein n=1 Tax=Bacillus sp. 2205SS5-2 TaxID=3109031 RepID=UPI003004A858
MVDGVIEEISNLHISIKALNDGYIEIWKKEMVLTWRWWLNVALLILPWFFWLIFRRKECTNRLLLAGLFVYVLTSVLDSVGVAFGLWMYAYTPLPYIHSFFMPWDFSSFPVMVMFLIQYKPNANPYIKAIIFACISAFLFEPIFVQLKVYKPLHWEHYFSFPFYFLIYVIAHRVSRRGNFEKIT